MDKVEYDLDTSGGLMEEIQSLIAPPQSDDSKRKQTNKDAASYRRPAKTANRDTCDACKEDGDLLCCDLCPASFHLLCCDPPLEDEDVPTGEWICNECKFGITKKSDMKQQQNNTSTNEKKEIISCPSPILFDPKLKPFERLTKYYKNRNPQEFELPVFLQDFTVMPGDRKRRTPMQAKKKEEESQRLCFVCSKSSRIGNLINCDFCPLVFHCDCLTPPLAQEPIGLWMCPSHPENFEPKIRTPRFSERSQVMEELKSKINHNAIILQFFKRAKKERILMNRKNHQPKKKRVSIVPDIVKAQYRNPPSHVIPNYDQIPYEVKSYMKPIVMPTEKEKEEWLSAVVDLQCSIACNLENISSTKSNDRISKDDNGDKLKPDNSCKTDGRINVDEQSKEKITEKISDAVVSLTSSVDTGQELSDQTKTLQSEKLVEQKTENILPDSTSSTTNESTAARVSLVSSSSLICRESNFDSPEKMEDTESRPVEISFATDDVFVSKKVNEQNKNEFDVFEKLDADILKDPTLLKLDERLLRVLAYQRLRQLSDKKNEDIPKITQSGIEDKKILTQIVEKKKATAVLSPLNGCDVGDTYIRHGSLNIGTGGDVDLYLPKYGFCNYISGKHATIFFDQECDQYELLNYSEHGTIVDNVLYSCDFSEKLKPNIISSSARYESQHNNITEVNRKPPIGRTTKQYGIEYITQSCTCRASASSLIGDSGAGWEGSAILHHGSYLKFGCLHFIFSIVDCATNVSKMKDGGSENNITNVT